MGGRRGPRLGVLVLALAAAAACKHGGRRAAGGPLLPEPTGIAAFSRHEQYEAVKISPLGTYFAAITTERGERSLAFFDAKTRELVHLFRPAGASMVGDYEWANDERVVVELVSRAGALAAPQRSGELYAIDASGRDGRLVHGYRAGDGPVASRIKKVEADRSWATILGSIRGNDRRVLVAVESMKEVGDPIARLYELDVYTGQKRLVATSPLAAARFVTDENGEPRLALGHDAALEPRAFLRDPRRGGWEDLRAAFGLGPEARALWVSAARRTVYVLDELPEGGSVVTALDLERGASEALATDRAVDPTEGMLDPATHELIALQYDDGLPAWRILRPEHRLARVLSALGETFAGEHVRLENVTEDQSKAIALVRSDRDPGRYFLVDTTSLAVQPLFASRPWIHPESMAAVRPLELAASDGLVLHGYLTLPPGGGMLGLPLVVLPHGGPHDVRDYWRFDPEAQLFASQGFAVLQVNYRGSEGYGPRFRKAGYGHWGDRMQQDVIDATRFVVKQGIADPRRICIYGASFGGLAALESAALAPDLFRCAAGYAGIYDLGLMQRVGEVPRTALGRGYFETVLGDPRALEAQSPVHNADRLRARVLLIHGARDERAPLAHAERMRDELRRRGRPVEWLVEPDEGHRFWDEGARERMYRKLVDFIRESTGLSAAEPSRP